MKRTWSRVFLLTSQHICQLIALFLAFFGLSAKCLEIRRIQISSSPALVGSRVTMVADYDLEGEPFGSIQWRFGKVTFFQYNRPPISSWVNDPDESGIVVNMAESNQWKVVLERVTLAQSGEYTCAVSVGEPSYSLAVSSATLKVIDPPDTAPVIGYTILGRNASTSGKIVDVGTKINLNCTAKNAYPAATLEWLVNDQPVDSKLTWFRTTDEEDGLKSTVSIFSVIVNGDVAHRNLSVKCIAQIYPLYLNASEVKFYPRYPPAIRVSTSRNSGDAPTAYSAIGEVNSGFGQKPSFFMKLLLFGFVHWYVGTRVLPTDHLISLSASVRER